MDFRVVEPGADGTAAAARATGTDEEQVGFLKVPYVCTDVSAFDGILLWAKSENSSTMEVELAVPELLPTEHGGDCTDECWGFHAVKYELSDQWRLFAVPFAELKRPWGDPVRWRDLIMSVQVTLRGKHADVWIDELAFYTGAPPGEAKLPK